MKLIQGVDSQQLNAGQLPQSLGTDFSVQGRLCIQSSLIAITERISQRPTIFINPHVIYCPTINGNRAYPFACNLRALSESIIESRFNHHQIPAKFAVRLARSVRETMHLSAPRSTAIKAR